MATWMDWSCSKCDFVFHGAGEHSALRSGTTTSIYCEGCEDVMDVLDAPPPWRRDKEAPVEPLACDHDKRHAIRPWTAKEPCPHCGEGTMIPDERTARCVD